MDFYRLNWGSAEIRVKLGHSNTFFTKRYLSVIFVTKTNVYVTFCI
jgi:hypothetical protein